MDGVVFDYSIGLPQEHPQIWVTSQSRKITCTVVHKSGILRPVQGSTNSVLSVNVQPMLLVPGRGIMTYFTSTVTYWWLHDRVRSFVLRLSSSELEEERQLEVERWIWKLCCSPTEKQSEPGWKEGGHDNGKAGSSVTGWSVEEGSRASLLVGVWVLQALQLDELRAPWWQRRMKCVSSPFFSPESKANPKQYFE